MYLLKTSLICLQTMGHIFWDPANAAGPDYSVPQELKPVGSIQRDLQGKEPFGFGVLLDWFCFSRVFWGHWSFFLSFIA